MSSQSLTDRTYQLAYQCQFEVAWFAQGFLATLINSLKFKLCHDLNSTLFSIIGWLTPNDRNLIK